jgi:hypothetical protein
MEGAEQDSSSFLEKKGYKYIESKRGENRHVIIV